MQRDTMVDIGVVYRVSKEEAIDIATMFWRGSVTAEGRATVNSARMSKRFKMLRTSR
jgi:hypothetical protein